MRICSLLPSATEIVCALGLIDELVAVSHECDYPPEVADKPRATSSHVDSATMSGAEIDAAVKRSLHEHRGVYSLDESLLAQLRPDLILTQELCDVCAVSYVQVEQSVRTLRGQKTILALEPTSLDSVLDTIRTVGRVTNRLARAEALAQQLAQEMSRIGERSASEVPRPRVACLEWLDPPFAGGHWIPEMVRLAGGDDVLGRSAEPSYRLGWDEVLAAQPEVVILMPCGFDVERTLREFRALRLPAGWDSLPAACAGRVYAVNANAYFSRPGPRLLQGLEILLAVLRPGSASPTPRSWQPVDRDGASVI